jgi:transcriptional regulator of NAD metabolism
MYEVNNETMKEFITQAIKKAENVLNQQAISKISETTNILIDKKSFGYIRELEYDIIEKSKKYIQVFKKTNNQELVEQFSKYMIQTCNWYIKE